MIRARGTTRWTGRGQVGGRDRRPAARRCWSSVLSGGDGPSEISGQIEEIFLPHEVASPRAPGAFFDFGVFQMRHGNDPTARLVGEQPSRHFKTVHAW